MSYHTILVERRLPAAILTLNRSERRNALNRQMVEELTAAFRALAADGEVRVAILTGAGTAFCAGMDLAELAATLEQPNEAQIVHQDAKRLSELYEVIYALPQPTIAAVNGAAVAGGAGLATVCDLALAAPEARFGYPEVLRGLVAAMVMPHLLRHVGERAARDLLLRGQLIDAWAAWRIGLVNEVAPPGGLMDMALAWAGDLAQAGPQALAATKNLLREFGRRNAVAADAPRASADARLTVECKTRLMEFLEKRPKQP